MLRLTEVLHFLQLASFNQGTESLVHHGAHHHRLVPIDLRWHNTKVDTAQEHEQVVVELASNRLLLQPHEQTNASNRNPSRILCANEHLYDPAGRAALCTATKQRACFGRIAHLVSKMSSVPELKL